MELPMKCTASKKTRWNKRKILMAFLKTNVVLRINLRMAQTWTLVTLLQTNLLHVLLHHQEEKVRFAFFKHFGSKSIKEIMTWDFQQFFSFIYYSGVKEMLDIMLRALLTFFCQRGGTAQVMMKVPGGYLQQSNWQIFIKHSICTSWTNKSAQ